MTVLGESEILTVDQSLRYIDHILMYWSTDGSTIDIQTYGSTFIQRFLHLLLHVEIALECSIIIDYFI